MKRDGVIANPPRTAAEINAVEKSRFFEFVIPFAYDLLSTLLILVTLVAFEWMVKFAKLGGLDEAHAEIFGRLHSWGLVGVLFSLTLLSIVRLVRKGLE